MNTATTQPVRGGSKAKPASLSRYRWAVGSRLVAAIAGGYALASALASALSLVLPLFGMARVDAVMTGTLLAFVSHAVAALWAFGCATVLRAWVGIAIPTAIAGAVVWWLAKGH